MRTILLIFLLASLLPHVSRAADIDVYTGEAVVASQDAAERRRALPMALEYVFQKYSGLGSFEDRPGVEAALRTASSIVLSFHYRDGESTRSDGSKVNELRLVASFSAGVKGEWSVVITSRTPSNTASHRASRSSVSRSGGLILP